MRQIIHLDLDAFFASVEVLLNPDLKDRPVIVAMGNPQGRGVVSTASYEARRFGVHSAMPLAQASRLCPQAVIVPVRHAVYRDYSRRVMDLLRLQSPLVEQVSIDEAYVEVGERIEAEKLAAQVQEEIQEKLGLSCTLGVATNKLVSKIACNTVKPHGLIVVPPGGEKEFLSALPVEKLPGVGPATRARLERWSVNTIGDLARIPADELRAEFGKHGVYLAEAANGRDESPIVTDSKAQSISEEITFDRDTRDASLLERELGEMSEHVAAELERQGYQARTVAIKLRYADFKTITRQCTVRVPTREAAEIKRCALDLLRRNWDRRPVRLIGVGGYNLVDAASSWQLAMELPEGS